MNRKLLLLIFGLTGMAALIYEITWIRPLSIVFGTTIYAVSTIIASFILGLAIGSWLAGKFSDKIKNPLKYFGFLQIGIGVYGVFLLPIFSLLPNFYLVIYGLTYPNQSIFMFLQVLMAMILITIPATMMGTTLPLMMKSYSLNFSTIGRDVGRLDASNSVGAVFGTIVAGFLMIPFLGIQTTIIITAMVNIAIGIGILSTKKYLQYQYLILIVTIIGAFFYLYPGYQIDDLTYGVYAYHDPIVFEKPMQGMMEVQQVMFYKESMYGTIIVVWMPDDNVRLTIDGKTQCSTIPHVLEGNLNLASITYELYEYNYGKPDNALNVGLGCGFTSKWFSERVHTTTIEIDTVVVEANKFFYSDGIDHDLVIDDGRNWLVRNDKKFDIITTEPFDPYVNNGGMYTLEYFSLLEKRISENGVVTQWVPNFELTEEDFHILYNTFHSVFPHVYIYEMEPNDDAQWVMIGSKKPLDVKQNELFLFDSKEIKVPPTILNTDDKPVLEFSTALNIYD